MYMRNSSGFLSQSLPPNYRGQLSEREYLDAIGAGEGRGEPLAEKIEEAAAEPVAEAVVEEARPAGLFGGLLSGSGGLLSRVTSMFGLGGRKDGAGGPGGFSVTSITDWLGNRISRIDTDDLIILAIIFLLISDGVDDDVLLIFLFLFFFVA